ncbi:MAG: ROK family protein, partial [Rhodobacteraceae bacterium]|nr:ROK family protein [Paracoccaceae bacterium]
PADIATAIGRPITYVNDCRAFALSEAVLGAGQGYDPVIGLIIGTGLGGGICSQSKLLTGALGLGGEFGHVAAPATLTSAYNLPLVPCGCGRLGCAETYLSGPGMTRLALALTGHNMTPPQVAAGRGKGGAEDKVWAAWCAGMAEFLLGLTLNIDPEAIIIGGGLSAISGLCDDLSAAMQAVQLPGYGIPKLLLAQGGAASGARGAALAALAKPSGSQYG